jgi:serine/threonine protein phosphatase PrpC
LIVRHSGSWPNPESRTTFSFAVLDEGDLLWGVFGDSPITIVSSGGAHTLAPRDRSEPVSHRYLGWREMVGIPDVAESLQTGVRRIDDDEWVIVATDGRFEAGYDLDDWHRLLEHATAESDSAEAAARKIVQAHIDDGGEDSLSVAVAAPDRPASR